MTDRPSVLSALRAALTPRHETEPLVWTLAVALVVLRTAVFTWMPHSSFDSDQAVMGLMAKHLSEGRAFPLFLYGQDSMLAVEAWLAAPLFAIAGPSIALLKLPLIAINALAAVLLVSLLHRESGLAPWAAFTAASFFIFPPPGTATMLVEPSGGNQEPFLYVLLIWLARQRPLVCGAILGFGFIHREFTIYALVGLVVVEAIERTLWRRDRLWPKARMAAGFAAVWIAVALLRPFANGAGPGTTMDDIVTPGVGLLDRLCRDIPEMIRNAPAIYHEYLAYLFGIPVQPMSRFAVRAEGSQGMPGMWIVMASFVVLGAATAGRGLLRAPRGVNAIGGTFVAYLATVGVSAVVFYAWGRCAELDINTLRYGLLALFAAVALAAAALAAVRSRRVQGAIAALVLLWFAASLTAHVRLLDEYIRRPPPNWRGIIADYLVERGVRYARADYWTAYHVTFLTGERVIVSTTDSPRIAEYEWLWEEHQAEAWWITKERCANGLPIIPQWYVCPPHP